MKGIRITVDHEGQRVDAARVDPPASVTMGAAPASTIVIPELRETATLFDHYGGQYRLHPVTAMTGALSFTGFRGPYDDLEQWRTRDGRAVPIGLRDRACGELHLGSWRFRFLHTPPRRVLGPFGPLPVLSREEAEAGAWVCTVCHRKSEKRIRFCRGCGGDVASVASGRWAPGTTVLFAVKGARKVGRIVSGPDGAHRVYVVEATDGGRFSAPEVLLDSLGPS